MHHTCHEHKYIFTQFINIHATVSEFHLFSCSACSPGWCGPVLDTAARRCTASPGATWSELWPRCHRTCCSGTSWTTRWVYSRRDRGWCRPPRCNLRGRGEGTHTADSGETEADDDASQSIWTDCVIQSGINCFRAKEHPAENWFMRKLPSNQSFCSTSSLQVESNDFGGKPCLPLGGTFFLSLSFNKLHLSKIPKPPYVFST